MTTATQPTRRDVQNINWQAVFNHATDHSTVFEAGDPLPRGRIVASLQTVANVGDNGTAARIIQRAVIGERLRKTENGYTIVRDGPGTGDLRQALDSRLRTAIGNGEQVVIQSPTSSGKTYTPSTTRWRDDPELTGDQPVILFSKTTDARDSALASSETSYVSTTALYGRTDSCPLARGDYDKGNEAGNAPISAPDGGDPSAWFKMMCKDRGIPVSVAHSIFEDHADNRLPCCGDDTDCPSATQWTGIPRDDEDEFGYDVLHATHPFARVPQLIENCNLIIDELPDFTLDTDTGRWRKTVSSYLKAIDAPVQTWEGLMVRVTGTVDAGLDQLHDALEMPDTSWFRTDGNAHALAPGIVEAILTAEQRTHGRWVGETRYTYPALIPGHDGPEYEVILRIVFDDSYDIRLLQEVPDFSEARSVIGLDAYPTVPKWRANTVMSIETATVVDETDRHKWRRNARNLELVQVEDNKNTWTKENFNHDKVGVLCTHLRREHGAMFRTGITSKRFKDDLQRCLMDAGVADPDTMYFGNEKSQNSFDSERIGLVAGCISPSDETLKDWLALLDRDATPKRETTDGHYRGQEWVGPDSDVAEDLLAEVQQDHVLQACGRYARSPQIPDDGATVYVLTNVLPEEYVDDSVEAITIFGDKQRQVLDYLSGSADGATAAEIAEQVDAGRNHVHNTLKRISDRSWIGIDEDGGRYNSRVYWADHAPERG